VKDLVEEEVRLVVVVAVVVMVGGGSEFILFVRAGVLSISE
jgi:hypothetical protein